MSVASWVATVLLCACVSAEPVAQGNVMDLEGSRWKLHSFVTGEGQQALPEEVEVTLSFDASRIGGTGGCNRYGAAYQVDEAKLRFGNVMATRMACSEPHMLVEKRFFETLATVARHETRGQQLWLSGLNSTTLVFNRAQRPN